MILILYWALLYTSCLCIDTHYTEPSAQWNRGCWGTTSRWSLAEQQGSSHRIIITLVYLFFSVYLETDHIEPMGKSNWHCWRKTYRWCLRIEQCDRHRIFIEKYIYIFFTHRHSSHWILKRMKLVLWEHNILLMCCTITRWFSAYFQWSHICFLLNT